MSGYTVRHRGGLSLKSLDFACLEHGAFDDRVPPDTTEAPCPECGEPSEQVLSAPAVHTLFAVSASRGRNDAKPHHMALSTRAIAEGQPVAEWKAERKAMWAEHSRKERKGALE